MARKGSPKKGDDGELPPKRAAAQKEREQELLSLIGLAPQKERLGLEIEALERIVRSNRSALKLGALSAADRLLLLQQNQARALRIGQLKQQLEGL